MIGAQQIYLQCAMSLQVFSYSFVVITFLRDTSTALAARDCPRSIITQPKGVYRLLYSLTSSGSCSGICASFRFFVNDRSR